jgi:hypothetical protein
MQAKESLSYIFLITQYITERLQIIKRPTLEVCHSDFWDNNFAKKLPDVCQEIQRYSEKMRNSILCAVLSAICRVGDLSH